MKKELLLNTNCIKMPVEYS